jgi:hypothetical protein
MTAAMAHADSATRTCRIRETESFRKWIDHITGGMIDGLNDGDDCLKDGSPRYIIPKTFYESLPFPAHVRHDQLEATEKLGRGRMAEWEGPEDNNWVDDDKNGQG